MFSLPDLFSVAGRTALVTGGATGLGRICAEALLSAGARVLIASRKAEACEAVAGLLSEVDAAVCFVTEAVTGNERQVTRSKA